MSNSKKDKKNKSESMRHEEFFEHLKSVPKGLGNLFSRKKKADASEPEKEVKKDGLSQLKEEMAFLFGDSIKRGAKKVGKATVKKAAEQTILRNEKGTKAFNKVKDVGQHIGQTIKEKSIELKDVAQKAIEENLNQDLLEKAKTGGEEFLNKSKDLGEKVRAELENPEDLGDKIQSSLKDLGVWLQGPGAQSYHTKEENDDAIKQQKSHIVAAKVVETTGKDISEKNAKAPKDTSDIPENWE